MDYKKNECNLKLAIKSNCKCIDQKLFMRVIFLSLKSLTYEIDCEGVNLSEISVYMNANFLFLEIKIKKKKTKLNLCP